MINYPNKAIFPTSFPCHFLSISFAFPFNSFSLSFHSLSFLSFPFHVIFISAHFCSIPFICFHFLLISSSFPFDILFISIIFVYRGKWGGAGDLRSTLLAVGSSQELQAIRVSPTLCVEVSVLGRPLSLINFVGCSYKSFTFISKKTLLCWYRAAWFVSWLVPLVRLLWSEALEWLRSLRFFGLFSPIKPLFHRFSKVPICSSFQPHLLLPLPIQKSQAETKGPKKWDRTG